MPQSQEKVKGVADIVFLIDVSGSMQPCIDALKQNISTFIDSLSGKDANNTAPVKDWRASVVGYRDHKADPSWFAEPPFTRDVAELKANLNRLSAEGGGDEPESLLDALYKVIRRGSTAKGAQEEPGKWRYRSDATRVVVVFTDATFHPEMSIPEARGGTVDDIRTECTNNRIILSIFAPDGMDCYGALSAIDKAEWEAYPCPSGPQEGLKAFTSNQDNFKETLTMLAKSISASAQTEAL